MTEAIETFEQFLVRREAASTHFINGNCEPLLAISAERDPATFFPPSGGCIGGAQDIRAVYAKSAASFSTGSTGRLEVLNSGAGQQIGFWTGLHDALVMFEGQTAPVTMKLRTTEVFRCVEGRWILIHRHADPLSTPKP